MTEKFFPFNETTIFLLLKHWTFSNITFNYIKVPVTKEKMEEDTRIILHFIYDRVIAVVAFS